LEISKTVLKNHDPNYPSQADAVGLVNPHSLTIDELASLFKNLYAASMILLQGILLLEKRFL